MKIKDIFRIFGYFISGGIGAYISLIIIKLIAGESFHFDPFVWSSILVVAILATAVYAYTVNRLRNQDLYIYGTFPDNEPFAQRRMVKLPRPSRQIISTKVGSANVVEEIYEGGRLIGLVERPSRLYERGESDIKAIIRQKKEDFFNIANVALLYKDETQIRTIYNDYFTEPTIEQLVNEMTSEVGGDIKGALPQVIEAGVGGKDIRKWISTIKVPNVSVAEMFRRYQRETIKNDQVILGLELVDVDLTDLNRFNSRVNRFIHEYDIKFDENQVEDQRLRFKKKAAEETLVRLEKASGWVLVEGKFKISELPDQYYKCIYTHPVNEYLGKDSPNVTISTTFHKDGLEPSVAGNYAQSVGMSIPMKVYGKVWMPVDRSQDNWELQITPLAIY